MPYTLKTSQISVKDPETGEYSGVDILAEQTEQGLIAELQAEGTAQVNRINQAAVDVQAAVDQAESDAATIISDTQASIDTLEEQKNTIAQTVASMAELGTDTTLSTPGMAADAGAVGDLSRQLSDIEDVITDSTTGLDTKAPVIINTASGAIASFSDGANGMPIKKLVAQIEPVQDLHGYDSPWPAGGGKNLLPLDSVTQTINGITVTVENGTVKLNGTATETVSIIVTSSRPVLPVGNYFANGGATGGSDSTYRMRIVVYNSDNSIAQVVNMVSDVLYNVNVTAEGQYLSAFINVFAGTTVSNIIYKPMVIVTSEMDRTFAPYSNICPISGHTGCEVNVTGINIWDEETEIGSYDPANGEKIAGNDRLRSKNYIKVIPGSSIYIYLPDNLTNDIRLLCYDRNHNFVNSTNWLYKGIFQIPSNTYYLTLYIASSYGTTYLNNISFNYPATETGYHSFGTTIPISWQTEAGTVYGGTLDVVSGKLKSTMKKRVLDGSENWTIDTDRGGRKCFYIMMNDLIHKLDFDYLGLIFASNMKTIKVLGGSEASQVDSIAITGYGYPSTNNYLYIIVNPQATGFENITTADALKAWLAQNNTEVVYRVEEPTEYDLTPQEMITLYGQNNIWSTTGDTEVTYPADTKLYIDGKLAEIQATILENIGG